MSNSAALKLSEISSNNQLKARIGQTYPEFFRPDPFIEDISRELKTRFDSLVSDTEIYTRLEKQIDRNGKSKIPTEEAINSIGLELFERLRDARYVIDCPEVSFDGNLHGLRESSIAVPFFIQKITRQNMS